MEITVILPVYNKIKYIEKSVASILAQTFSDFELITVDDGSTDGSGELLDEIAASDTRVKVIHKQNGGVSAARNTALDAAQGEYIVFADGDDTVCPDWLETLFSEIRLSKADIVISGLTKVDEAGNILGTVCPSDNNIITSGELYDNFYELQKNGLLGFCVGKLFRKALFTDNQIYFDESLKLAEDLDFFMRLYEKAELIRFVRYAGYRYLQEAENSTGNANSYRICYLSQLNIWLRISEILKRNQAYTVKNAEFIENKIGAYISCCLFYRSTANTSSAGALRKLCGRSRASGDGALKPAALLYNLHLGCLCPLYVKLYGAIKKHET